MHLTGKKEGEKRVYIDYRGSNQAIIKNCYLLLRIDDLFDHLGGARVFSKLDLLLGYHQVKVMESFIPKITFRCEHYEFLEMSFRVTNSLAIFMN